MRRRVQQALFIIFLVFIILEDKNILLAINITLSLLFLIEGGIKNFDRRMLIVIIIPVVYSGIYGALFYPVYDVLKDIYYLMNPLLFLLAGAYIAKKIEIFSFLKIIILVGTVYSFIHILYAFSQFGDTVFSDLRHVRDEIGGGHIISTLSIIFCIFSLFVFKLNLVKPRIILYICVILNGLAFGLSGSRTFILIFGIIVLTLFYSLYQNKKWLLLRNGILIFLILLLVFRFSKGNSLIDSLANSRKEITMGDYTDVSEKNKQYRGWESYQAFKTYSKGNAFQLMIGGGAGKMIDLETEFFLANEYRQYIPILHNGFLYLLVKSGIFGLLLYIIYFLKVFRFASNEINRVDLITNFQKLLLIGSLCSIYISNYVISAIFNPTVELLAILCGAMLYYLMNPVEESFYSISNEFVD